jgi:predicted ATP-grasp superfamily ATP-dependent carboligase
MSQPLLILGASARAAAWSAQRAGFETVAGDLFLDEDLRAGCPAWRCERYPKDFVRIAAAAPAGPWMYTGGLENYPDLVDRIGEERPLWGNAGAVLRAVRDPFHVAEVLADAGIATPGLTANPRGLPCDGTWLRKPRRSSGGYAIRRLSEPSDPAKSTSDYFQEFVPGTPCSAVFVAAGGQAVLLGVTEQIVGDASYQTSEFRYAGSIGPLALGNEQRRLWETIGNRLASAFELVGLFGVDAIVANDTVWPIEVNPRYTASIEIIERGTGIRSIALHAAACRDSALPSPRATTKSIHGKAIVYADRELTIRESFALLVEQTSAGQEWPVLGDIPAVGTTIADRHPIVTVFAAGASTAEVRERLRTCVATVRSLTTDHRPPTPDP